MQLNRAGALTYLLKEAGFSWAAADELSAWIDKLERPGCSSDDVAGMLLEWRRAHAKSRLASARMACGKLLNGTIANSFCGEIEKVEQLEEDVPQQLRFFYETESAE